ncbi:uncharacterized protein LOC110443677 [Mizuhopecten yessoensis]|uniref:uncharacterized protein LOC110443677 n=1 Tax=Mizuhopecten yessoensis TaxID=6573 RepID=UPI000B45B8ED|nr:uncharacterized protein LOC110443677 [Mizuhopecten yessoensis]
MSANNSTASGLELISHRSTPTLAGHSDIEHPRHTYKDGFWEPPADYQDAAVRRDEDQLSVDTVASNDSNKYKSFSKLIKRFSEKTSMQGVPYINNARLWYAKMIWSLLLVIAIGWMCFHLFYLITQFVQWPKQTKIKLSFSNLEMPAVTICNVNPLRNSVFDRASLPLQELIKYVDPKGFDNDEEDDDDEEQTVAESPNPNVTGTGSTPAYNTDGYGTGNVTNTHGTNVTESGVTDSVVNGTSRPQHRNATNGTGNGTINAFGDGSLRTTSRPRTPGTGEAGQPPSNRRKRFVDDFDNDKIDEYLDYDEDDFRKKNEPPRPPRDPIANLEDTFRSLYSNEKRMNRVDMGHQIKDMLISCSFDGYECFPDNFTRYQTMEYGNCYTIQSSAFTSKSSGPKHGLSIILFMENDEYLRGLTQGYGARVTINDQYSFPYPADEGFFVSSAFETHIGLKQINIERLGHPYGTCDDGVEFEQRYRTRYSRQTCQSVCHQQAVIDSCGCHENNDVEVFLQSSLLDNIKRCKTREELQCQFSIGKEFEDKTRECVCETPCKEKQWVRSISTRQWPTEAYTETLLRGVCQRRPQQCKDLISKADDRKISLNFLKIVVYYQDLNHEEINEDPEIETAQFASDVGGAVGLWIGLSILSMFEVFQLIVELCQYGIYKCKHMGNMDSNDKPDLPLGDRKSNVQAPSALNFNQPQFAKDYLYDGRFATARYQY